MEANIGAHGLQIVTEEDSLLDPDPELTGSSLPVTFVMSLDAGMTIDLGARHRLVDTVDVMNTAENAVQIVTTMADTLGQGHPSVELVHGTGAQHHR